MNNTQNCAQIQPLALVQLSTVEPTEVPWLWPLRIPTGRLTVFAGDPGVGKSYVTLDLAARMSKGLDWPDKSGRAPIGDVLLMGAEDDLSDTVRPRLDLHGADPKRVHAVSFESEWFTLDKDMDRLGLTLDALPECRAVFIDPIQSFTGKADTNIDAEYRRILQPLAALARSCNVAIIAVAHLNKREDARAIYRIGGSVALAGVPRAVWLFGRDRDDQNRRLMIAGKASLGPDGSGLAYRLVQLEDDPAKARVRWEEGEVTGSPDELLGSARAARSNAPIRMLQVLAQRGCLPIRDWQRVRNLDSPEAAERELEALRDEGIGTIEYAPTGKRGGRPSKVFRVALPDNTPVSGA